MADDSVKASTAFRGFFTLGTGEKSKWLKIAEGTSGMLSEKDTRTGRYKTVIFEYGDNNTASAPISYDREFMARSDYVTFELLVTA